MLVAVIVAVTVLVLAGADNEVQLNVQDACWFYIDGDPVLVCTSTFPDWPIYWRRDDLVIGMNGIPVGDERHFYNITSYTNNTVRQEKLHVYRSLVNSSTMYDSEFSCESHGVISPSIHLEIPDCAACQQCQVTIDSITSDEFLQSNSSKAQLIWMVVCIVVSSVLLVIGLGGVGYLVVRKRRQKYSTRDEQRMSRLRGQLIVLEDPTEDDTQA